MISALLSLFMVVSYSSAHEEGGHKSHPTRPAETEKEFGEKIGILGKPVELKTLVKNYDEYKTQTVVTVGTATKVCEKMGCWVVIDDGVGTQVRVTMDGQGFVLPKAVLNKKIKAIGSITKKELPVKALRHYLKDEGKSETEIARITEPQTVYLFEARGIYNPVMNSKEERASYIQKVLDRLYPAPPIPLDHKDSYTLLIAVLLSAQCTDVRVNQITPRLFEKADSPQKMVKLKVEEIQEIIRPCGLSPRKAKAIHELSQILIDKHRGKVPKDMEALEELPGVGHKTASVVMAQSFGVPAFPVDTHIHRLAQRWRLTNGKNVEQTEADLKKLFQEKNWNKLHLQIIFYGRERCQARGACQGRECEICSKVNSGRKSPIKTKK